LAPWRGLFPHYDSEPLIVKAQAEIIAVDLFI